MWFVADYRWDESSGGKVVKLKRKTIYFELSFIVTVGESTASLEAGSPNADAETVEERGVPKQTKVLCPVLPNDNGSCLCGELFA